MKPGSWSTITWSRGDRQTGSIKVGGQSGGIRLVYRHRTADGKWRDVDELVPLVETGTQFGGSRTWFQCLSCRSRCRILYGGAHFRCRRCHRLRYDTQYELPFARAATRAIKIRKRLGDNGGIDDAFPDRPKGMHRATYEALEDEYERLTDAWAHGVMRYFRM